MEEAKPVSRRKKLLLYPFGLLVGVLNGLFGAGGGMIAVPLLRGLGIETENCHATSIAIILPLAVASGILYFSGGNLNLADAWPYLPGGALGAVCGAWLLPRIGTLWLRRIFGVLVLAAAVRMLLK